MSFRALILCFGVLIAFAAPAWAQPRERVVYGADAFFPPYSLLDPKTNEPTGFEIDLIREIARVMNLDLEVRVGPWSPIRADFEAGAVDIVGLWRHPSRESWAAFSTPFAVGVSEIFVRRDGVTAASLGDLAGKTVAIEAGALTSDAFMTKHPNVRWVAVPGAAEVMRAVSSGQTDAGITGQDSGRWAMREYGLSNLTSSGPPIHHSDICFCVRPGRTELLAKLNQGLEIVKATGVYNRLYDRWLATGRPQPSWWATFGRILAWGILPLVALVVFVALWNRSLASRVAGRTRELAVSRAKARSLVEHAPEAILVVRADTGAIVEANPQAAGLFTIAQDAFAGRSLADFLIPARGPAEDAMRLLLSRACEGAPARAGFDAARHGGSRVPSEWWAAKLPGLDPALGVPLIRVSVIDVSDRVRAERELDRLELELERTRRYESLGRLAGGVAHDVNNLLTTVDGCADLIEHDLPPAGPGRRALGTLRSASAHCAGLTRQLLAFAKGEVVSPRVVDLGEVVESIMPLTRDLMHAAGCSVVWTPPSAPIHIVADPLQLRQIVLNLAQNARDAMTARPTPNPPTPGGPAPAGHSPGVLTITVTADRGTAFLTVADSGPGITPADAKRIFDPFFTTKSGSGGLGLGLATCRQIAQQLGGAILLRLRPQPGACFEVRLPLDDSTPTPTPTLNPSLPAPANAAPEGEARILLVEDNDPVREVVRTLLTRAGWTTMEARSVQEALAFVGKLHPSDIVLSDLTLPGGSGVDVAATLRQAHPTLRVLYMSGYSADLADVAARVSPADRVLAKPFTNAQLLAALNEVVGSAARSGESLK